MARANSGLTLTHLVDFPKRAIAQLADNFPDVVGVDVPVNVLVLLHLLLDLNRGQTKDFAESSESHGEQHASLQVLTPKNFQRNNKIKPHENEKSRV